MWDRSPDLVREGGIEMDLTTGMSNETGEGGLDRDRPLTLHTRLEFEFAGGTRAPTVARQVVQGLGTELDVRRLNEVRLLVTELVTNCVRHAGIDREATVTVSLELDESNLYVAVSNPGAAFEAPEPPPESAESEGGRGLVLVDRLADRWGIDDVHEARVWFEVSRVAAVAGS
jgi:anti-sigma regulatory factor (Ser/Thr protein kinase)